MNYSLQFTRMWNESSNHFPVGLQHVNASEKKLKEAQFEYFLKKLKAELNVPAGQITPKDNRRLIHLLSDFFKNIAGYPENLIDVMFSEGMLDSTRSFICTARKFDPGIGSSDLFQAIRNVWIMNGLQFLMDRQVCLTPPIFAYSMLYPYTDNYLDDPSIPSGEKQEFCLRFGKRLKGEDVGAYQEQERKIFRMIELIEAFWDRDQYPKVYESLLGIHEAQARSTQLVTNSDKLLFDDIFAICVQKGGMSVVADGYLVFGDLTSDEEEFFYYYGAYLQLLDDLQDVSTDLADSLMTGYSGLARKEKLDLWLNKTYYLGLKIINDADRLNSSRLPVFKALMKRSIDLFLIGAVFTNDQFFSKKFIREFEAFSPLSFSFARKKDHTLSPYQDELFEQILEKSMTNGVGFVSEPGIKILD
ncbi:MAG: class 1 isoprenoid biosynthesis enzyme [Mangrovibacterium sp.]